MKSSVSKRQNSASQPMVSSGLRRYLYLTAAITGAVILIVEILGAKMLSPYIGTSHFVWTAQIGVTLISLAAGYYFGGWLVDRSQDLGRLYGCIFGAGIYLALTVFVVESVADYFLRYNLAAGALLSSAFLFFVPLTLLAAVGPFCIRVLTISLSGVGGQVGRLSAISTMGSVFGTFVITFLLIPFLPSSMTMYLTAGILFGVVLGYYFGWGKMSAQKNMLLLVMVALVAVGFRAAQRHPGGRFKHAEELFRGNSNFGLLQVIKFPQGNQIFFLNDYLTQNTYDPRKKKSLSAFTYMLHGLARVYTPKIENVLCIGLGIGIVPMQFAREGAEVDVVEINPAVIPVARDFFDLEVDRLNISIGDGRHFVNRSDKKYDTIILDAFLGDSSPSHLMTREAFGGMRKILQPEGTLVINCFGDFERGRDFFTASLHKTLLAVFKSVRVHATGHGNVFFVASDREELTRLHPPRLEGVPASLLSNVRQCFNTALEPVFETGRVLTDDYNPVEYYDALNRERFRRQTALFMKQI